MRKVIIGICGGIAAYKAAELTRFFMRSGAEVQVIMTAAAKEFVAPLTFQTLTGRPVYSEMYGPESMDRVRHVDLTQEADLFLVAPATANTIAKMARGLADNLLTAAYLASNCPVVIVPSMNVKMFDHPAVAKNIEILRQRGCHVMDPDSGELACGDYGRGRMPEPADIFAYAGAAVRKKDYAGIKALVTAGPTREHMDPVRFISNPSSGLMGYAVARALAERGAQVNLISGPTALNCPAGVKRIDVTGAAEMAAAVKECFFSSDLVIKAAAVSDFCPVRVAPEKIKKNGAADRIDLMPTEDILFSLGQKKGNRVLVGFAAETENAVANARDKLSRKNLDLIVVNNLKEPGAGFASLTNRATLVDRSGATEELPLMAKEQLAHRILDRVAALLERQ